MDVERAEYAHGRGRPNLRLGRRRARKTLSQEEEAKLRFDEIFPVNFVDISGIAPPSDAELERILSEKHLVD